ncbi:glycosyltransferase family 2 protein [Lamprocystis purpurea]|uniref:glycosyltransferase family 2 protein n=1 Tax=Lamprocystis purpurea TaxID=61598 RepID=UPI0003A77AA3|nr:glycosyltransferase family 2 protein [Lamprocystis purpurea]
MSHKISVILPCRNEAASLETLLPRIRQVLPAAEILVVDDASADGSAAVCAANGVRCIRHPYRKGNGAAIKSGARAAVGDILIFMDADGQHDPADIPRLLKPLEDGFDMVVGARRSASQASLARGLANRVYNRLASYMTGQPILDLTSGFRVVRADLFREFIYLLPNEFSYPTTITMAFFRAGYHVGYVTITAGQRIGKSHIRPLQDGLRFLLIIFKIGSLYSPLKIFVPVAVLFFLLGTGYWIYTYSLALRLSIMTIFMLTTAVIVFLIGLVSEQITQLMYRSFTESVPAPRDPEKRVGDSRCD